MAIVVRPQCSFLLELEMPTHTIRYIFRVHDDDVDITRAEGRINSPTVVIHVYTLEKSAARILWRSLLRKGYTRCR